MKRLLFVLGFILLTSPSFAVTEFVSTINKTGQDYDTIALWEDAMDNAGDLTDSTVFCGNWDAQTGSDVADNTAVDWDGGSSTGTLIAATSTQYCIDVTAGSLADDDVILDVATSTDGFTINGTPDSCILTAHIYDDDGDLDNADWTIDGLTTSSTNYMHITAPVGERHDGTFGSGAAIVPSSGTRFSWLADNYVKISWLELDGTAVSTNFFYGNSSTGEFLTLENNLFVEDNGMSQPIRFGWATKASNNVFLNVGSAGNYVFEPIDSGKVAYIYNNTFYGCGGAMSDAGSTNVQNNFCANHVTNCFAGFETGELDYNICSDSTCDDFGGTGNLVDKTDYANYFVNTSTDFHLKVGGTMGIDLGTDLSGDGNYPITIDLDGSTRSGTWDIGADEYEAAAATRNRIIIIQ